MERQSRTQHIEGAESDPKVANGKLRKGGAEELYTRTFNARRQYSHSEHSEKFRQRHPSDDEGAPSFKDRLRSSWITCTSGMDAIGGQPLRGRILVAIHHWRPPDSTFRSAFHTGWN